MVSGMGFCCSSYKNKTTRTFEHRGEAWRVLVGAKTVKVVELCNFLKGFSYNEISKEHPNVGCSFDIDGIGGLLLALVLTSSKINTQVSPLLPSFRALQ